VNLSACLAKLGKSVLLIDADPQAAATSGLGFQRVEKTIYDVLLGRCGAEDAIKFFLYDELFPVFDHLPLLRLPSITFCIRGDEQKFIHYYY
jgi:cellulose biosynthesis protein BcsQ